MRMNPEPVFVNAIELMLSNLRAALDSFDLREGERVVVVPHQPSAKLLKALVATGQSEFPDVEFLNNLSGYGNVISASVPTVLSRLDEVLEQNGRPKWRFSSSINWDYGPVDVGLFGHYVGSVYDTSVSRDDPIESDDLNANYFPVDEMFTVNFSIAYTINNDTALDGTRLRFAINNLFDEDPPLADETYGFFSDLHSARGRVFHVELRKKF